MNLFLSGCSDSKRRISRVGGLWFVTVALFLLACPVQAQDTLDTLLERGYVSRWLVCGPFKSDISGGIIGALGRGEAALGNNDYMSPVGGIARVRPEHLLRVKTPEGLAIWQWAAMQTPALDLAPFFPKDREGVSFAAFYAPAAFQQAVYFEIQSVLGVRVFLNGFPVRDISSAPLSGSGMDRFVLNLSPGTNLIVLQIPGARLEEIAALADMSEDDFRRRVLQNRRYLSGTSGFEIALSLMPAAQFGDIVYTTKLTEKGTFSGTSSDPRQDMLFTVFNPGSETSQPVSLSARVSGARDALERTIAPLQAGGQASIVLPLQIQGMAPGAPLAVEVTLQHDTPVSAATPRTTSFQTTVNVRRPPLAGTVYFITGMADSEEIPPVQREQVKLRTGQLAKQISVMSREPDYGFYLGNAEHWRPLILSRPQYLDEVKSAVLASRCAANAGFGSVDERIVCGELIVRNLAYGQAAAGSMLGNSGGCYFVWDMPNSLALQTLAPQTPQILSQSSIAGVISNIDVPNLPPLSHTLALDGADILHRRKKVGVGPVSLEQIRQSTLVQRQEMSDMGFDVDLIVNESSIPAPEPFFLGASTELAAQLPAIKITGDGGRRFFEQIGSASIGDTKIAPLVTHVLNRRRLTDLPTQSELKMTHAEVENMVLSAEKFASLAMSLGATYPSAEIDKVWRQLLYAASPERVGLCSSEKVYSDMLAGYRESAAISRDIVDKATEYIAGMVNVDSTAPEKGQGIRAIVVFNPSSWMRTDLCSFVVQTPGATILEENGNRLPYEAAAFPQRGPSARLLSFVARDVPALGYKTYYLLPVGMLPPPSLRSGTEIDNGFLRVTVDPEKGGAITSITNPISGNEYLRGLGNEVVALSPDGRNVVASSSKSEARATVTKTGKTQHLTVTAPFMDGTITRVITLRQGVARIDCELRLEGVSIDDGMLAVEFEAKARGAVPVFGERFGAVVGRRGKGVLDAGHAALRWVSSGPNDHVRIGPDIAVPFGPVAIVYGQRAGLAESANRLQTALIKRGIPSVVWPDSGQLKGSIWTDSTQYEKLNEDFYHGTSFRIIIGGPEQNSLCRKVYGQLPRENLNRFLEELQNGAAALFYDSNVDNAAPVPTLIFAGIDKARTEKVVDDFIADYSADGVYSLSMEAYGASAEQRPQPESGIALVYVGAKLAVVEEDGTLVLALNRANKLSKSQPSVYRYSIVPFDGTWRTAGVVQTAHAYNEGFVAAMTDLSSGKLDASQSLIEVTKPGFVITSVKVPGYDVAYGRYNATSDAYNGLALRGYETTGQAWEGELKFFIPMRSAFRTDPLESEEKRLPFDTSTVVFQAAGFGIETLHVAPAAGLSAGISANLSDADVAGLTDPVFSRYWEHNIGSGPIGFQPVSIMLNGELEGGTSDVSVVVSNNLSDKSLRGKVFLTASEGLSVAPDSFDYNLQPGQHDRRSLVVLSDAKRTNTGGLVARTSFQHGGVARYYQDVLELVSPGAEKSVPIVEVRSEPGRVLVTVINKNGIPLEGSVDIITAPEFWPELKNRAKTSVLPARQSLSVPAFGRRSLAFAVVSNPAAGGQKVPWIKVRLRANGHVVYKDVPVKS